MLIDWFTVAAQIVNFLILIWLLKRFLYRPILSAIDAREARVAAQLAHAKTAEQQATAARETAQRQQHILDQQHDTLLQHARDDAQKQRQHLLDDARREIETLRAQWRESLHAQRQDLAHTVAGQVQTEVFAIARHALSDLTDTTLEARMCDVFVRRLRTASESERSALVSALTTATTGGSSSEPIHVRSAFALDDTQRSQIEQAVRELAGTDVRLQFDTTAEPGEGIALDVRGYRVAWGIADYLATLERRVDTLLDTPAEETTRAG